MQNGHEGEELRPNLVPRPKPQRGSLPDLFGSGNEYLRPIDRLRVGLGLYRGVAGFPANLI